MGYEFTILVVDDEPHISRMLKFLFERQGYRVLTASTGEEAVELVKSHKPDVVFLDLLLPGKDGLEVLAELRSDSRFADLPIYLLTAAGQDAEIEKSRELGATGYITKPFSPSELLRLVSSISSEKGSHGEGV